MCVCRRVKKRESQVRKNLARSYRIVRYYCIIIILFQYHYRVIPGAFLVKRASLEIFHMPTTEKRAPTFSGLNNYFFSFQGQSKSINSPYAREDETNLYASDEIKVNDDRPIKLWHQIIITIGFFFFLTLL